MLDKHKTTGQCWMCMNLALDAVGDFRWGGFLTTTTTVLHVYGRSIEHCWRCQNMRSPADADWININPMTTAVPDVNEPSIERCHIFQMKGLSDDDDNSVGVLVDEPYLALNTIRDGRRYFFLSGQCFTQQVFRQKCIQKYRRQYTSCISQHDRLFCTDAPDPPFLPIINNSHQKNQFLTALIVFSEKLMDYVHCRRHRKIYSFIQLWQCSVMAWCFMYMQHRHRCQKYSASDGSDTSASVQW